MKTIKIGKSEYRLAESAEDISIRRFVELKSCLIQKETGVAVPSLIKAIQGFIKGFDTQSKSEMLISLYNYVGGLQKVESMEDAEQMIFSLICYEKDEDETKYDKTQAKEKLERMNKEGLKQGIVIKEVESFIKGSPILSGLYLVRSLLNLKE